MIIKPKVRGFICVTAHPGGCAAILQDHIKYVKSRGPIAGGPKNVLIVGASMGYGFATRIVSAFGCRAATIGVFFERPSEKGRTASAGWYNTAAFTSAARADGLYAANINGDAFSDEIKEKSIERIKADLGTVDLVIYSLASPRRTHPRTGETFKPALKPVGQTFSSKGLDTDRKEVKEITIPPASEEEIRGMIGVMGGEDWSMWIDALESGGVLAPQATTIAYSYIGPKVTWPIYNQGTIGLAKKDLEKTGKALNARLARTNGRALVSINKAVVSQSSSAIPVVPLCISLLFKVMKEKGTHEGCVEQIYRLFSTRLYDGADLQLDEAGRIRLDDWEMDPEVQREAAESWTRVTTENLNELTDFDGYQIEFLKLFGFRHDGVDYDADVDPAVDIPD